MASSDVNGYRPVDTLCLWWTGDPARPALIGELRMVRAALPERGARRMFGAADRIMKAGQPLRG